MDIDGTTLDNFFGSGVQPGCKKFLETAVKNGYEIVFLTGRSTTTNDRTRRDIKTVKYS